MSEFIIDVTNTSSETGTINPDVGFSYTDLLDNINEANIKISGSGTIKRGLLELGSIIEIKKDGTRDFYGLVDDINFAEAGTVVFHASGYEVWMAKENGSYANSPYKTTASATIASEIIGESSYFTAGTINTGFNTDFRIATSDSIYNALSNLARKTQQDIGIDYVNLEVDVLNHKGNSTPVATFNHGLQITNMRINYAYPLGNKIKVYGKSDGTNQIEGSDSDATSIAAYGEITRVVVDRSVMSTAEANKLAEAELALTKDPTKIFDFNVINPGVSIIAGDHVYLNATDMSLDNEEVRVVGIERGMSRGSEYLTLQVTNPAYKTLIRTRNKQLARIEKEARDNTTYMQGSGNLSQWKGIINGNNSVGLNITFNVGDNYEDEAGNLRVDSLTLDYDVDKYRREVGTATESDRHPSIDSSTHSGQDNESTEVDDDTSYNNGITFADSWTSYKSWTNIPQHGEAIIFHVQATVPDWNSSSAKSAYARIKHVDDTDYYPSTSGIRLFRGATEQTTSITDAHTHTSYTHLSGTGTIYVPIDPYLQDFNVELDHTDSGNVTAGVFFAYYVVSQHKHGSGDYKTNDHKHNVSVGDAVSDAGSVNASQVSIYLDFWNTGTLNWDNKHSILNTGKTLDTEVDISNSGTYPDAKGYWRVRIITNNASPDLIQGVVSVRHAMDN